MLTVICGMVVVLKKILKKASDIQKKTSINFANFLDIVAKSFPKFRIRFTTLILKIWIMKY